MQSNLCKRIIPCLDVKDGRTVKGVNFLNLRDLGDPVELAALYSEEGADEVVLLDISATHEGRKVLFEVVRAVADTLSIPFTVGGGIQEISDVEMLLASGADKVSVNSAAIRRPELIDELAKTFGSQCVVAAIDVKHFCREQRVFVRGGREATDRELFSWAHEVQERGAGEILLTSMDRDGTKEGYDCPLLKRLSTEISLPLIASGGAGSFEHVREVLTAGGADAALAASIFHEEKGAIRRLKQYLREYGVAVRDEY